MTDTSRWLSAVRNSHNRMATLLKPLGDNEVTAPSYATEWTIAQVASHLGSQAEIFALFLEAGLSGQPAPDGAAFGPIWNRWNALTPMQQVTDSVAVNEEFVTTLEHVPADQQQTFALSMFGTDLDLAGLAALRLGEHAVHTWDIAVALDPTARLAPDAVDLLIDKIPQIAARAGKPAPGKNPISIDTVQPERRFQLTLNPDVALGPDVAGSTDTSTSSDGRLRLPAEALVRLVYGRLRPDTTPPEVADDRRLAQLRDVFPGF
jgi:uncharacterized protein (TIGR03083 family)